MPFSGSVVKFLVISALRILACLRWIRVWGEQVSICQRLISVRIGGPWQLRQQPSAYKRDNTIFIPQPVHLKAVPAQSHRALACFWSSVGLSTKSSAMQKMTWKAASPVSQHHLAHQLNSQCLDIRVTLCSFLDLAVPKSLAPLEPVSPTCCVSKAARSSTRKPAVNPTITHH